MLSIRAFFSARFVLKGNVAQLFHEDAEDAA